MNSFSTLASWHTCLLASWHTYFSSVFSHPKARLNLFFIIGLYLVALGADFICPWQPTETAEKRMSYQPPSIFRLDSKGLFFYKYLIRVKAETFERSFDEQLSQKCRLSFFAKGKTYKLFGLAKTNLHLFVSPNCPEDLHILGTDKLGRDYFSRLLFGLRPSLFTGLLGILIAFPLGIIYGSIAGYKGGAAGEVMMRFVEVILSLPTLYFLVIMAAILPPSLSNLQRLSLITIILSFIGWAGLARVVRGQVLSVAKREFVQAAYLIGAPDWKILFREIIPQLSSYLIIAVTLSFPAYILGETTLSFLGLGVSQPDASLGNLLSESRELSNLFLRPWLAISPSLILVLLTWSFNSLGDQLRDIFDSKT